MTNPKGQVFQREVLAYVRGERGFEADSLRQAGREDEGDMLIRLKGKERIVLELKNVAKMNLGGWLEEAKREAENFYKHRSREVLYVNHAVVHKRRGKGAYGSYVTMSLDQFLNLIEGLADV